MYKLLIGVSVAVAATCFAGLKYNEARTEQVRAERKQRDQQEQEEHERRLRKAERERLQQEREELEQKKQELTRFEEERTQRQQAFERDRQFSEEFIKRHSSWMYEHDSDGQIKRNPYTLTPMGKRFVAYVNEAKSSGIRTAEDAAKYAYDKLAAENAAAQRRQEQQKRIDAAEEHRRKPLADFDERLRQDVVTRQNWARQRRREIDHEWSTLNRQWAGKRGRPTEHEALKHMYQDLNTEYDKVSAYERTTANLDDLSRRLNAAIISNRLEEAERLYGIASDEWKNAAR